MDLGKKHLRSELYAVGKELAENLELKYCSRSSLLQVLLHKAVQKTNKTQEKEKKFLVEDNVWKTSGRSSDDLRNEWNTFVKIMKRPPVT